MKPGRALLVALIAAAAVLGAGASGARPRPSQVLVLYNAGWTGDAPLTDPGQDSREVAEHYVGLHTDPATGEKPYILGLRCRHRMGHLDGEHLVEESADNGSGVVLQQKGRVLGPAGELRDSRLVELVLPARDGGWRLDTLRVGLRPDRGEPVEVVAGGRSRFPGRVSVQENGAWNVRLDGRSFVTGSFTAEAAVEDASGALHTWKAAYADVFDVSRSRTGPDGVRDDRNYLEDVEQPLKAFLEDPANARPDGTLLKDHVLFLVVCYGLPKTAAATFGVARGITGRRANYGAAIALEQRLQLVYYDVEGARGFAPRPMRFEGDSPFTAYLFRAPQAWPLYGPKANPFLHPLAYRKDRGELAELPDPPRFTPGSRAERPGRHLFFAMRVDGTDPLQARGLVDRAAYASRHAGPGMGRPAGVALDRNADQAGTVRRSPAAQLLWSRGFRHLYDRYAGGNRLALFLLKPGSVFWNDDEVFLPGGIWSTVISHNGWSNRNAEMIDALDRGVSVTAGAARVYRGAPHIHDKSWWDDGILYPLLLRGYTVGEALLANQIHLAWITSFVGDPLYRLPPVPEPDGQPPRIVPDRVRTFRYVTEQGRKALRVSVDLATEGGPEVAQMRITAGSQTAVCPTFEARPHVNLLRTRAVDRGLWEIEFIDPYGNRSETSWRAGTTPDR